jgi:hypothetical protein
MWVSQHTHVFIQHYYVDVELELAVCCGFARAARGALSNPQILLYNLIMIHNFSHQPQHILIGGPALGGIMVKIETQLNTQTNA